MDPALIALFTALSLGIPTIIGAVVYAIKSRADTTEKARVAKDARDDEIADKAAEREAAKVLAEVNALAAKTKAEAEALATKTSADAALITANTEKIKAEAMATKTLAEAEVIKASSTAAAAQKLSEAYDNLLVRLGKCEESHAKRDLRDSELATAHELERKTQSERIAALEDRIKVLEAREVVTP